MKRVAHKSRTFSDAERWDIQQQVGMSSEERQQAAKELKVRVFGRFAPDVRERLKKK
jgi:hypothetical protein